MAQVYGGIDCGGTKFLCVIGTSPENILESRSIPTTAHPEETMKNVARFFLEHRERFDLIGIGLGCFGPIDLNPGSPTFGKVGRTGKAGWMGAEPVKELRKHLVDMPNKVRYGIQTDVAAAALAEAKWGKGIGIANMTYVTVGTGIGGAHIIDGRLANGHSHSELGHMFVRRHPDDDFRGICRYHLDCVEGLASGPAIAANSVARTKGEDIHERDPVFDYVAYYIGQLCSNIFFCNAPERIVLGGGVMRKSGLIDKIREYTAELINGYLAIPAPTSMDSAIVLSEWVEASSSQRKLEKNAGALGALLIAEAAARGTGGMVTL